MRRRDRKKDDGELGRLLRRGDPVGDGRDPDSGEIERMRRRVLEAAAVRRAATSRGWPVLRLVGYAAAGLAVVLAGWALLLTPPEEPGTSPGAAVELPTAVAVPPSEDAPSEHVVVAPAAPSPEPASPPRIANVTTGPAEEPAAPDLVRAVGK